MKTILLALLLLACAPCLAQDTPEWWPPPLPADSVRPDDRYIYERPLANFNHPLTGAPTMLIAVRCARSGQWWRVPMPQEYASHGAVGDTLIQFPLIP